jgi:glycosyltransferase involved in cell wall biosynthesis
MDNKKLVSVALATWNGSKFLRKQLDSIYQQTYKNIEVIVTDDLSGDDTPSILNEYKKEKGLKFIVNSFRLGIAQNFAKAISFCNGDYIALADQDDIWQREKIETLLKEINGYSLIFSDAILIDENDAVMAKSFINYSGYKIHLVKDVFKHLVYHNFVTGCTALFNRKLLGKAFPIPTGEIYHDWWLAQIASKANGIKYLNSPLTFYRQHASNNTGALRKSNLLRTYLNFFGRIFSKREEDPKYLRAKMHEKRLKAIVNSDAFSKEEKQFINVAILFFEDYLKSGFHLKTFRIGIKYSDYIYPDLKGFLKFKAMVGGLFL